MKTFLVLMSGPSPEAATMVAATANPELIAQFADRVLRAPEDPLTHPGASAGNVEQAIGDGRREALKLIRDEAEREES